MKIKMKIKYIQAQSYAVGCPKDEAGRRASRYHIPGTLRLQQTTSNIATNQWWPQNYYYL